jgi:tungstate transport system substrate-binding protein
VNPRVITSKADSYFDTRRYFFSNPEINNMKTTCRNALAAICLSLLTISSGFAHEASIIVQSTTSTANSGLYDHLLPLVQKDIDVTVHVVAVGTGQAIKNARNCDGDVLLVHAKAAEEKFVNSGYGLPRHDVMYNDFVIVGPSADPAGIRGSKSAADAFAEIAAASAKFASRGDNSGTHTKELALWQQADIKPLSGSGDWYLETGSGMGATLNTAVGSGAYTLTDRATWITYRNQQNFEILVEGDKQLFNQYGIIMVNPNKCDAVKQDAAQKFIDWILSDKGQAAIADYQVHGQQLFFPNARM